MVRKAMQNGNVPYVEVPDEAAFYGPKIDVQIWSAIGREFTLATNQVDFAQPPRFDLAFINSDGVEETPLCIHRAPLSTHERMIGFLIEHYAGSFPVWLAPQQVAVIPITDSHNEYAAAAGARAGRRRRARVRRHELRPHERQDSHGADAQGALHADHRRPGGGERDRVSCAAVTGSAATACRSVSSLRWSNLALAPGRASCSQRMGSARGNTEARVVRSAALNTERTDKRRKRFSIYLTVTGRNDILWRLYGETVTPIQ